MLRRSSRVRLAEEVDFKYKHRSHIVFLQCASWLSFCISRHIHLIFSDLHLSATPANPLAPLNQFALMTWVCWISLKWHRFERMRAVWGSCVGYCFCSEPPAQLDDVGTDDLPPPSVGNGTSAQSEESSSNGLKCKIGKASFILLRHCHIFFAVAQKKDWTRNDIRSVATCSQDFSGGARQVMP